MLAILLSLPVGLAGQEAPKPPPIRPWRYDEDYSYLRGRDARSGEWWEDWKFIPLSHDGDVFLTLGAELRARYEAFENDLGEEGPLADHDYWWLRALPYADLHIGQRLRFFSQLISAFEFGDEAGESPIDEDRSDLLQAFADVRLPLGNGSLTLRGGRQVIAYGSERLISTRFGPNVLRSFDLAKLIYERGGWRIDLLYGRPVSPQPGEFDDTASRSEALWAAYATTSLGLADSSGLDLYYIGLENEKALFNQGAGEERRHTLGTRFFGRGGGWDWNFELFAQLGTFADGDIHAWSAASDSGYTFEQDALSPRIGFKVNIISGDHDPGDPSLETFNPLFPKGKYFGEIGLLGPYNLINLHPSLDLRLSEKWNLGFASVFYWRESLKDGIYNNGGILLRSDSGSGKRYIGTQFDAAVAFKPNRTFEVTFSYSAFLPGAFIQETGTHERVDFAGIEMSFPF